MQKNVGGYDRLVRFVVGPVLLVVGLAALGGFVTLLSGTVGLVVAAILALVGAILLTTAVTQTCPINSMLGVDTYSKETTTDAATEDTPDEMSGSRPS